MGTSKPQPGLSREFQERQNLSHDYMRRPPSFLYWFCHFNCVFSGERFLTIRTSHGRGPQGCCRNQELVSVNIARAEESPQDSQCLHCLSWSPWRASLLPRLHSSSLSFLPCGLPSWVGSECFLAGLLAHLFIYSWRIVCEGRSWGPHSVVFTIQVFLLWGNSTYP